MTIGAATARRIRLAIAVAACLLSLGAVAQVFQISGGTSSLFNASGGSIQVFRRNGSSRLDVGFVDGKFSTGFYTEATVRNLTFGVGDQGIAFNMPTDVFFQSHYFQGRGISVLRKNDTAETRIFAGSNMFAYSSPFFSTGRREGVSALLVHQQKLSARLTFFSRNAVTHGVTSLNALEWKPAQGVKTAVSVGVASGEKLWAASGELIRSKIEVTGSFSGVEGGFRRLGIRDMSSAETEKDNLRVMFKPWSALRLTATRNHFAWSSRTDLPLMRSVVNTVSGSGSALGFALQGSIYFSQNYWGASRAFSVSCDRQLKNVLSVSGAYSLSSSQIESFGTTNISVQERLHPRLVLSQVISRAGGQTNVSYGGEFSTNRVSFSLSYQNTFIPFSTSLRSQFQQMALIGVRIRLPHDTQVNLETSVLPDGHLRYTSYATTYAYRQKGLAAPVPATSVPALWDNIIAGRVHDEKGHPVAGAAIRIGDELAFTDFSGRFEMRKKKAREYPLAVALDEFMLPGEYDVVSAPASVKAEKDAQATPYEIVLRSRVITAAASAQ